MTIAAGDGIKTLIGGGGCCGRELRSIREDGGCRADSASSLNDRRSYPPDVACSHSCSVMALVLIPQLMAIYHTAGRHAMGTLASLLHHSRNDNTLAA